MHDLRPIPFNGPSALIVGPNRPIVFTVSIPLRRYFPGVQPLRAFTQRLGRQVQIGVFTHRNTVDEWLVTTEGANQVENWIREMVLCKVSVVTQVLTAWLASQWLVVHRDIGGVARRNGCPV